MFFNYLSICTYKHLQVKLLYSLLSFISFKKNFFMVLEYFCFKEHSSWSPSWLLSSLFYASPSMLVVPSLLFLYTARVCFPSSMSIPFYASTLYIDDCRPFFTLLRPSLRIPSLQRYCVLLQWLPSLLSYALYWRLLSILCTPCALIDYCLFVAPMCPWRFSSLFLCLLYFH